MSNPPQTIAATATMLHSSIVRAVPRTSTRLAAIVQQIRHYGPQTKSPPITYEKGHELDVQSHSSKQAMRERDSSGSGENGAKKDPKEGHPKAPEPVIGMQDERGHSSAFCPSAGRLRKN